jgi:hypothetical protein
MLIANPIYDAVFKYLMSDPEAAKVLLSAIMDQEIEELEVRPQELLVTSARFGFTVLRIDFSAVVLDAAGERRKVLIELQKSRKPSDLARFRRYLGDNYAKPDPQDPQGLPIVSIYFLGFSLDTPHAGLHIAREYRDLFTGEALPEGHSDSFVERLTHDCYIVQASRLPRETRTHLERLLSVFDQRYVFRMRGEDRKWLLNLPDDVAESGGEGLRLLLSRLHKAALEEEVQLQLEVEEVYDRQLEAEMEGKAEALRELIEMRLEKEAALREAKETRLQKEALEREAEETRQQKEALEREAEETRQQKEALEREAEETRQQKEALEREAEETRQQKEALEREIGRMRMQEGAARALATQMARMLSAQGLSAQEIAASLGMEAAAVEALLE